MTPADPREDARHRRADELATRAGALAHAGDLAQARVLYRQAGDLAAAVARACAPGVDSLGPFIAARAVTLWCNAARFADARDLAAAYLRGPDLDPFARLRRELAELKQSATPDPERLAVLSQDVETADALARHAGP